MKKLLYILSWIPFILFKLVLVILGLVIVPMALLTKTMTFSALPEEQAHHWPDLFWLWGNDEEGCPDWWFRMADKKGGFIAKFPQFWWYAVRNPVNNFRYLFFDTKYYEEETNWPHGDPMEAQQMKQHGFQKAYRWRFFGWKAGYRKVWLNTPYKYSEFWIGWKLGSDVPGLGFSLQYRRKRDIGT